MNDEESSRALFVSFTLGDVLDPLDGVLNKVCTISRLAWKWGATDKNSRSPAALGAFDISTSLLLSQKISQGYPSSHRAPCVSWHRSA